MQQVENSESFLFQELDFTLQGAWRIKSESEIENREEYFLGSFVDYPLMRRCVKKMIGQS